MTITVNITPEVQAELACQAAARGRAIEAYAASLLEKAVRIPAGADRLAPDKERAQAAAARIRELRQGVTLDGLTIRELIDEGRP
jgi:plasmid stability protein